MPYVRIPASDLKWSWNRSLITQQNKTYCTAIHLKNIKTKTHQCNIQLWFTQNDNIVRFFVSHVCMHFKLARHCTLVHFLESKGKKCHWIFEKINLIYQTYIFLNFWGNVENHSKYELTFLHLGQIVWKNEYCISS